MEKRQDCKCNLKSIYLKWFTQVFSAMSAVDEDDVDVNHDSHIFIFTFTSFAVQQFVYPLSLLMCPG